MSYNKRTHSCGQLSIANVNETVVLNGWVAKKRDLGGIIFVDIRDRYGITQIKVSPEKKEISALAAKLGNEFVISAKGKVIKRESANLNISTGEIEIDVDELQVLNESLTTPFVVEEDVKANEDLRLQYRYLDLRRKKMMDGLLLRNTVYQIVHKYFAESNFVEVETPILMKSTPEGARDYLVPSRVHKGKFYALPQSPQTYKQILMVSGLDKYVQICKCFRDEDLRADRQPEFTQIDVEMSFVEQEDVFNISEKLFKRIWKESIDVDVAAPFPMMTYDDAMSKYGSDKPDMRIKDSMVITNLTDAVKTSEFKVFNDVINSGGIIAGIKIGGTAGGSKIEITRKISDSYTEYAKKLGFGGLAFVKTNEDGSLQSSILKFLNEESIAGMKNAFDMKSGDYVFILSGEKNKVLSGLGQLRLRIAEDFKLLDDSKHEFIWITDFPLFHFEEEENRFVGEHHVFTSPKNEFMKYLDSKDRKEIESIRANCYDLVYNGSEMGSGSIRIHNSETQKKVFNIIGLSDEEAVEKFGFILEAFKYGAPPHGGVAFGFDRIVAMLSGTKSIRDIIAFPKTVSAASLMDNCPSPVIKQQLDELGIQLKQ
ncbi:MAG: aspartate--tRNA ligase [Ignavibacteria bacterium]|nr:aspartate--tRNA ligase [Ignavibacteria bacterium]